MRHEPAKLPDPLTNPTMPLWPDAGRACGVSRGVAYEAARTGDIPAIRIGNRWVVPTAALRRMLGLDDEPSAS